MFSIGTRQRTHLGGRVFRRSWRRSRARGARTVSASHASGRETHVGVPAIEPGFIVARGLLPIGREIEVLRPREGLVAEFGVGDVRRAIRVNEVAALRHEIPDTALENEAAAKPGRGAESSTVPA